MTSADNIKVFDLTKRDTLFDSIEDEKRKLGGEQEDEPIRLYMGKRPILLDLKKFLQESGKDVQADGMFRHYNMYLLSHSVGVLKEGGWRKVNQIGYRME